MCARKITNDSFFENNETVSYTECTGIAPSGIVDEAEAEDISSLYSIHTPENLIGDGKDGEVRCKISKNNKH